MTRAQMKAQAEAAIERLIAPLDDLDGNADDESENGIDQDNVPLSLQSVDQVPAKRGCRRAA